MSGRICTLLAMMTLAFPVVATAAPTCGDVSACAPGSRRPAMRLAQANGSEASERPAMRPRAAQMPASIPVPPAVQAPQGAPIPGRPVRRSAPAAAGLPQPAPVLPDPADSAAAPLASWSLPVPDGCPSANVLAPGENRIAGQVRGDAICRLLIPDGTAAQVTLVGPGPVLPDLRVVLYSRTTSDLVADQPLPVPPGRQELRVLGAPQAPGRTALPFDLLIRLD